MRLRPGRRLLVAATTCLVLLTLGVGGALAVFPDSNVVTYTGCLTTGGAINSVKQGDSPLQPCASPKQVVKLSGGDITNVQVSGALTGGGDNGLVTIGLDASKTVPAGCKDGQVPKWDTSGSPAQWSCADDKDTTYSAGTGLDLTSGAFSVEPGYRLPQSCATGDVAKKQDDGSWSCASDQVGGAEVWSWQQAGSQNVGWTGGYYNQIHEMSLPAGSFLLTYTALAEDDEGSTGNGDVWIDCELDSGSTTLAAGEANSDGSASVADSAHSENAQATLSMQGVVTLGSAGTVKLMCQSHNAKDHLVDESLTASRITTLHAG